MAGLAVVGYLIFQIGPGVVWNAFRALSWRLLLVFLFPTCLAVLLDTLGWRAAFGFPRPDGIRFGRLFRIRWAGEAVNNLVPSGYLGGEAVKVYLLRKAGVSGWTATEGVVIGKAIQIALSGSEFAT